MLVKTDTDQSIIASPGLPQRPSQGNSPSQVLSDPATNLEEDCVNGADRDLRQDSRVGGHEIHGETPDQWLNLTLLIRERRNTCF